VRILIVTPWFPTAVNPVAGVFVARDATVLAEGGDDVRVVHLVDPALLSDTEHVADEEYPYTVERIPWSRRSAGDLRAARRLLSERMADADVLHTHAFQSLLPLALSRVALPWVHSEHWSGIGNPSSLTPRGRIMLRVAGRLLRRPDVVTTVSEFLAERVRGFRSGPVAVVPSVVEPAGVLRRPDSSDEIRLVAVGNLVDGKDPLLAAATVHRLRELEHPTTLTWVGDGPLRATLEGAAAEIGGICVAGAQDAGGVAAALDESHIFLLPTKGETLCLAALEAISHGRPVVISANGGQRDYVTEANGRLVEDRSADAYARAVLDLWTTRNTRTPESIAATLDAAYTPEAVRQGYHRAYRRASSSH
jgi:glycosyltransferase involved in cell wall biosynthesis